MPDQGDLFAPGPSPAPAPRPRSPIARRSDPETSHAAALELNAIGRRDCQASAVLSLVEAHPGATSSELATGWSASSEGALDFGTARHIVGRRLSELERLGLIRRESPRRCERTGRSALTWRRT